MDSHRIALTPTVARQTPRNEFGNVLKSALQQAASVGGVALASISFTLSALVPRKPSGRVDML